jgi:hypothetical protein
VHRDELDDAIDAAVRDIMRAEPSAGLRQRVLRGIATPDGTGWLGAPRLMLAAGVALSITLAVTVLFLWTREAPSPQVASRTPAVVRPQVEPAAPASLSGGPEPRVTPAATRATASALPGRPENAPADRMVSATSLVDADDTVVIAPLDTMEAIDAIRVEPSRVQVDEIQIAPLRIEPLRLDPLSQTPR